MTFQILSNNNNISSIKITSDGIWQHENPLDFALPLLTVQISFILIVSRLICFVFTPLHQPNVVAEIMGGILLGPSALGRYEIYLNTIFPKWSSPVLNTISSFGLLLFMFLIGLELDLSAIRNSSHTSFLIAFAGILLPFLSSIPITLLFKTTINGLHETRFLPLCIFNGASLSITAFAVLARILSEMNILNTSLGETAMTAAAFNDVVAWILLALAVALSGGKGETAPIESLWILLSGVAFVIFMLVFLRPLMARVTRGISLDNKATEGGLICLTLVGVLISGFTTDMLGIHSIFGAFIFGLTIPREGNFGNKLGEKMEILVSNLLLPLYFATSGLKTDVTKIRGLVAWGLVILVTIVAIVGKIFGSFVAGLMQKMKVRDALTIGVLMSTKGLVELIVLNIGREKKVLDDETFAIFVLMALFTTFLTTPTAMAIYKPTSLSPLEKRTKTFQILACLPSKETKNSIMTFIDAINGPKRSHFKLHVMNLMGTQGFKEKEPTEIICKVAQDRNVGMVVLPFHPKEEKILQIWDGVRESTLMADLPCSVGLYVDQGLTQNPNEELGLCILFFGGADDRETLNFGITLTMKNPNIKLTVIRFIEEGNNVANYSCMKEIEQDDEAILGLKKRTKGLYHAKCEEHHMKNEILVESILNIGRNYKLVMVGKKQRECNILEDEIRVWWVERDQKLGLVGDILASVTSVLVIQHKYNVAKLEV